MTTIRTVAKSAGVSPSTVSRVFARPEIVAPEARQRVLAAADALGYRPNPVARSLARGRTGNLGLLVPDIANPFFAPMIKAVQREARRHELALFLADSDEQVEDELALARAMAKQVDGLVLASSRLPEDRVREIMALAPVVLVSRDVAGTPAVLTPPDEGLTQAVEHLHALGHRSVVFLAGPRESYAAAERRRVMRAACRRLDLPLREMGPFQPRFEAGVRAADLVLADGATAVVAHNDQIAVGLMSQLAERGCRVPDEVSVVGIDDSWTARMATPALTTVRVPAERAGVAAVRLLVDTPAGPSRADGGPARVELPTELIVRASTAAAPGTAAATAAPGRGRS
jgi:DNA-binding LacI/PurR family transcriptional regulator